MKKILVVILSVFTVLSMTACNAKKAPQPITQPPSGSNTPAPDKEEESGSDETDTDKENPVQSDDGQGNNILVAYFTLPEADGVDAVARASRVVVDGEMLGNTQYLAQIIQREAGGDLFAIETVQEYPASHDALVDFAEEERRSNARPELSTQIENLEDYDVIFLGYPNWYADLPMPLYTFLEEYDLSGKTIIPFCPHGGSRFSNTIKTIASLQPNATVITDGYTVSRNDVPDSENDVVEWVHNLNLDK